MTRTAVGAPDPDDMTPYEREMAQMAEAMQAAARQIAASISQAIAGMHRAMLASIEQSTPSEPYLVGGKPPHAPAERPAEPRTEPPEPSGPPSAAESRTALPGSADGMVAVLKLDHLRRLAIQRRDSSESRVEIVDRRHFPPNVYVEAGRGRVIWPREILAILDTEPSPWIVDLAKKLDPEMVGKTDTSTESDGV